MAFEREAEALAALSAQDRRSKLARLVAKTRLAVYRRRVQAYADCFLGPDGELTESGAMVVADLARVARLGQARPNESAEAIREDLGARRVVLRVMEFLREDPAKLRRLARQIRESNDE